MAPQCEGVLPHKTIARRTRKVVQHPSVDRRVEATAWENIVLLNFKNFVSYTSVVHSSKSRCQEDSVDPVVDIDHESARETKTLVVSAWRAVGKLCVCRGKPTWQPLLQCGACGRCFGRRSPARSRVHGHPSAPS